MQLISSISSRVSLRLALFLAVFFGLSIATPILVSLEISSMQAEGEASLIDRHTRDIAILAVTLSEPVWQITPEIAHQSVDVMASDPNIAEIVVITLPDNKPFIKISKKNKLHGPFISKKLPIFHSDQVIGEVTLTYAKDALIQDQEKAIKQAYFTSAISFLISIAVIYFTLQQRMVIPIQQIIDKSDKLAFGDWNTPIEFTRKDELGHLADSLELTRLALKRSFHELEIKNQQLREYSGSLESKVRQRTQELENTNQELEQALTNINHAHLEMARVDRMASLGSMVAGVAHELNTPIGNCLLVASTLADETKKINQAFVSNTMKKSDLTHYIDAATHASYLLSQGLHQAAQLVGEFKQVAVDQSSAQRRRFNLYTVFQEVAALMYGSLKKTPYALEIDVPHDIELDSYPGPLGQVFNNLVNNAILHGLDGRSEGTIRVSAEKLNQYVIIVFEDTGKGIHEDIINRIFEPFFTTKFGQGGSGLGLSITFNIVNNVLGGDILVSSPPNQGARFEITIPLIAPGKESS